MERHMSALRPASPTRAPKMRMRKAREPSCVSSCFSRCDRSFSKGAHVAVADGHPTCVEPLHQRDGELPRRSDDVAKARHGDRAFASDRELQALADLGG